MKFNVQRRMIYGLIYQEVKVNALYLLNYQGKKRLVRLVQTSDRGFNFEDDDTYKKVFKKHLYPTERGNRDNLTHATILLPSKFELKMQ